METCDQLIDLKQLAESGIWSSSHKPSVSTLYAWLAAKLIPAHHMGYRKLVTVAEVTSHLRARCWHWPKYIPKNLELSRCDPSQLQLVPFSAISELGIWHPTCLPCTRSLRHMVANNRIPYYQVSRALYFRREELVHCLVTYSRVDAQ